MCHFDLLGFSTGCTSKNGASTSLPAQEKRRRRHRHRHRTALFFLRITATGTAPPYLDTPAQARRVYPVIGGLTRFASPANVPEPKLLRAGHDHLIA
jgi:hypothetical protein